MQIDPSETLPTVLLTYFSNPPILLCLHRTTALFQLILLLAPTKSLFIHSCPFYFVYYIAPSSSYSLQNANLIMLPHTQNSSRLYMTLRINFKVLNVV